MCSGRRRKHYYDHDYYYDHDDDDDDGQNRQTLRHKSSINEYNVSLSALAHFVLLKVRTSSFKDMAAKMCSD